MGELYFCEHCVFKKQCKVKFSADIHRTKGTLDTSILIFGDLLKLYHLVLEDIYWSSFIITLETFDYIFWSKKMMSLGSSSNRKLWLRNR